MVAYLSRPKSAGPQPAIIVIHEAWGLNEQIREVVRRFAGQDFVAIAPHLFTREAELLTEKNVESAMASIWSVTAEGRKKDPRAIEELVKKTSGSQRKIITFFLSGKDAFQRRMVKDLLDCKDYLRGQDFVRGDRLGVAGFSLGGGLGYQVSTVYPFTATVSFYGENPTPIESVATIRGPVLGIYAGEDEGINSSVPELVGAMIKYKKEFELRVYRGAQHSFFNETRPRYDKSASADAWESTIWFFNKNLRR
jgi:carboxymethylenebutenolidase